VRWKYEELLGQKTLNSDDNLTNGTNGSSVGAKNPAELLVDHAAQAKGMDTTLKRICAITPNLRRLDQLPRPAASANSRRCPRPKQIGGPSPVNQWGAEPPSDGMGRIDSLDP
jgi:hypothetical protein